MSRLVLLLCTLIFALLVSGCVMQPVQPEAATSPAGDVAATAVPTEAPAEEPSPFTAEILKNLAYNLEIVGAEPVQLTDGTYEDAANRVVVNWLDTYALGTLNGEPAAAVILLANPGGSGNFSILAVVTEQEGAPVNVASVLLGDRLRMNWINIANDRIGLDLVGQGPEEPMCCGTQRTLLSFALEDSQIVEVEGEVIGVQPQITSTQVITFVPTVIPEATQTGSCFTNAIGLGRADAWRCTTADNLIHDPCFALEDSGDASAEAMPTVVCGADPIIGEVGFVLALTEPLPAPDPGEASSAWILQLADGTICGHLTGTVPGADGMVAPYGCADETRSYLMENFFFFDPVVYAQSVVFDVTDAGFVIESSVRIPVTTIWR